MRALAWHGKGDVRVDTVPDPAINQPGDVIVRVTSASICGADLHILDGLVPEMRKGDILGHEFMGEVVETGPGITRLKKGDRVVVPFSLSCGECFFCARGMTALCDNSNPDGAKLARLHGHAGGGLFGYSHLYGGYPGGQAQYVRVPFADHGPLKIPPHLQDEQALFLSDILPAGWMAAENAGIKPGDTVAVWGCGPAGQMAVKSAWLQGAGRVIAIDPIPERLAMAEKAGRAETIDCMRSDVYASLQDMTEGMGPDCCIDAVGTEAHGLVSFDSAVDRVMTAAHIATDRPHVVREAILCCRKGGTISIAGTYLKNAEHLPLGAAFGKGLTLKMGRAHARKYMPALLEKIVSGELDPSFVVTHRMSLEDAPEAYETFRDKKDGCVKVILTP
jgi:threonine dehydrogenase-like Zn-dependent dehydrogenase